MIEGIDLDHVAVAVEDHAQAWPCFAGELGGRWRSGGLGPGFAPAQLAYANGMRLEVLMPNEVERNDFLRRFLDQSGPGPHHLTFKVKDLDAALARAREAGIEPVNVDQRDPEWKEGFLHPRHALGVLVQLAQAAGPEWSTPEPAGFPTSSVPPAALTHIAHSVASLDDGVGLFHDLLGGREIGRGSDDLTRWVDLAWPGPGRLRLLGPTTTDSPVATWLGGRQGRVHHLAFGVAGADGPRSAETCGTRLVLHPQEVEP